MKLKEIYSSDFINQFGENADGFGQLLLLPSSPYIDLKKIAELLGIKLNYVHLPDNHSGEFDETNQTIRINQNHPATRKRFTIAHEIGHDVLGHHGISLRSTALGSYESVLEKSNEMAANNFAATLLMPRRLLVKLVKEAITQLGLDDAGLTKQQIAEVTKIISQELAVSEETMTYRLQNVRMFVKKDD